VHRPRITRLGGARFPAAAALAIALVAGCSTGTEVATTAASPTTSTESASPSTGPDLKPVVGERTSASYSLSSDAILGLGEPEPVDEDAVEQAIATVADWLDDHLDALQTDGSGQLDEVTTDELRDAATDDDLASITTRLASPDRPVAAARYQIDVYHDGEPQFVRTSVTVTHPDEDVSTATLVFHLESASSPVLSLAGPESAGAA
jgi:hypothetical protein